MFVKEVLCFDKKNGEGEVLVSDGVFLLKCYVYHHNCIIENQNVKQIIAFGCSTIYQATNSTCEITKIEDYFAYQLTAVLYSKKERIVQLGDILFSVDSYIPNDLQSGDFVSFSVRRFDCIL